MLYNSKKTCHWQVLFHGAGEGDRTLTASLEGWNSTIELHPHGAEDEIRTRDVHLGKVTLYH